MARELKSLEELLGGNFQGNLEIEGEQGCEEGSRYEGKEHLNMCYYEQGATLHMFERHS